MVKSGAEAGTYSYLKDADEQQPTEKESVNMTIRTRSDSELYRKLTKDLKSACAEAQKMVCKEGEKGESGEADFDGLLYTGAMSPSTRAALTAAGCEVGEQTRRGWLLKIPMRSEQGRSLAVAVETVLAVMKQRGWAGLFSGWWRNHQDPRAELGAPTPRGALAPMAGGRFQIDESQT